MLSKMIDTVAYVAVFVVVIVKTLGYMIGSVYFRILNAVCGAIHND